MSNNLQIRFKSNADQLAAWHTVPLAAGTDLTDAWRAARDLCRVPTANVEYASVIYQNGLQAELPPCDGEFDATGLSFDNVFSKYRLLGLSTPIDVTSPLTAAIDTACKLQQEEADAAKQAAEDAQHFWQNRKRYSDGLRRM